MRTGLPDFGPVKVSYGTVVASSQFGLPLLLFLFLGAFKLARLDEVCKIIPLHKINRVVSVSGFFVGCPGVFIPSGVAAQYFRAFGMSLGRGVSGKAWVSSVPFSFRK